MKLDLMCVRACGEFYPPRTAAVGPMSFVQIWTKLYSQLGRPLPKVWGAIYLSAKLVCSVTF